jgi:secondary thiamine-phosphate synthase enzyme
MKTIMVSSSGNLELIDITSEVQAFVKQSQTREGILLVYTPHTTGGITINENADPAVRSDMEAFLKKKFPPEKYYQHLEGNSPSHLMSSFFSVSETFIIENNKIILGTWQGIYFCEFDGPRNRKVFLKIIKG